VTGPDKIPAKLLKNCASSIYSSLCDLFNKGLSLGKLPNEWKLSNIVPILKKGPAEVVSNYRPISLLSLISKVAFTTNSYHTFPVNSAIYNSASSETGQPPHSFCTFSRIFIKRWRVETKSTLCMWTLQKRLTMLAISFCWLNFTSLE
jgi:hypothetical protein